MELVEKSAADAASGVPRVGLVYIHPFVQVGCLIGGEQARQADEELFWQLHEQVFEFVAVDSKGRVIGAFEILRRGHSNERKNERALRAQNLKRQACQAVGLAFCDHIYADASYPQDNAEVVNFISTAYLKPDPATFRPQTAGFAMQQNFWQGLRLAGARLFDAEHAEDNFFYCLQKVARTHGAAVLCQMALKRLLFTKERSLYDAIRQLRVDYVVIGWRGGVVAVVELDGSSHEQEAARERDRRKNYALAAAGIKLVRVKRGNRDCYDDNNLRTVLEQAVFGGSDLHISVEFCEEDG